MTIDERMEQFAVGLDRLKLRQDALMLTIELLTRDVQQDAENIRALARIAEIHERRLTDVEGQR